MHINTFSLGKEIKTPMSNSNELPIKVFLLRITTATYKLLIPKPVNSSKYVCEKNNQKMNNISFSCIQLVLPFFFFEFSNISFILYQGKNHILLQNPRGIFQRYNWKEKRRYRWRKTTKMLRDNSHFFLKLYVKIHGWICMSIHTKLLEWWKEIAGGWGHEHRAEETGCQGHLLEGLQQAAGGVQGHLAEARSCFSFLSPEMGPCEACDCEDHHQGQARLSTELTEQKFWNLAGSHAHQLTLENLVLNPMRPKQGRDRPRKSRLNGLMVIAKTLNLFKPLSSKISEM